MNSYKKIQSQNISETGLSFSGFHPPTSNTTYTPNQFFDVCLPNASRGVARLVGYMLRKTLGWCDEHGNPQYEQILVSYNELIKNAGISRDMIRKSIDEAEAGKFIICVRKGKPAMAGSPAVTALYELKWNDAQEYIKDPSKFNGFFAGEGNRTYIPNEFFDVTLKTEPLRIIKVVGAILRYTIGFRNRFGHRRLRIQVSISTLKKQTLLATRHLHAGLKEAIQKNYITRIEEGIFDKEAGKNSQAGIYTINWVDSNMFESTGQMMGMGKSIKQSEKGNGLSGRKRETEEIINQSEKGNDIGQKKVTDNQSEKDIGYIKEIKQTNKTFKQQAVVAYENLLKIGFDKKTSLEIVTFHPKDKISQIIDNQITWLSKRNVKRNKLGFLKKAIKENWSEPQADINESLINNKGSIFAKYFYAGCAGNKGEPATEPTEKEIGVAERYVGRLLKICPDERKIEKWGRGYGEAFKAKFNNTNKQIYISLLPALRSFGDEFYMNQEKIYESERKEREIFAKNAHQKKFETEYNEYLGLTEEAFQDRRKNEYKDFLSFRNEKRKEFFNSPYSCPDEVLKEFDSKNSRIMDFQEYFKKEILDFWGWDQMFNTQKLELIHAA